eukprot:TRINITY_DN13501_c0_g3_i3.p1 TRINITY_DN13501_c0_g3~~TRINITY_DN13501_c0_g3_i3.p1  ORF type:complete len:624 (-),score=144.92 TRINITY_DN13501_c0_g3_i3:649-2520(-)
MVELNNLGPLKIDVENRMCINVGVDSRKFGKYVGGGLVESVKMPAERSFVSLEEALKSSGDFSDTPVHDYSDTNVPASIYLGLHGVLDFFAKFGRLPNLRDNDEANKCLSLAQEHMSCITNIEKTNIDFKTLLMISRLARCEVTHVTSFIGGAAAQEVLKYVGKYTPLNQWLFYETIMTLPDTMEEYKKAESRYADYIAIYGEKVMKDISEMKIFMIGAGALGCELIKGFSLMGICCGDEGNLHCTDNDFIEWTNLNRQFLFRQTDIGKSKSDTACNAGKLINKDFKYTSYKELVIPETEHKFNADFWEEKDVIIGAVDNMAARRYTNGRCLWYGKTYLDSGTLGPRCNSTVIIANKSRSFTSVPDPEGTDQIPMCTVKNFPVRIEHTIEWGRSVFNDYFVSTAKEVQEFVKDGKGFVEHLKTLQNAFGIMQILERIKYLISAKNKNTVEMCTEYARTVFDSIFRDCIVSLLRAHPLEEIQENGLKFWGISRRPPTPVNFDSGNPLHNLFVISFVKLLFRLFKKEFKPEYEQLVISAAKENISKEALELEEMKPTGVFNDSELKAIEKEFEDVVGMSKGWTEEEVTAIEFEKDDDVIVDLIHAAANIRADSYDIKQVDVLLNA